MPFPGYTRLVGPESLTLDGVTPVRTPDDYALWQRIHVVTKGAKVWKSEARVDAYINFGRWVADCFWCKKGMFTRPDWGCAYCAQCGARYETGYVIFPDDVLEILAAILVRPDPDTQGWDNKQTVQDLLRENREELHL